jgi:hypothetical protein
VYTCKVAPEVCDVNGTTPPRGSIQVKCNGTNGATCVCASKTCVVSGVTNPIPRGADTPCTAVECAS